MAFNPQPTNIYISQPTNNPAIASLSTPNNATVNIPSDTSDTNDTNTYLDHPPNYDDTIIQKCKSDAIYNSTKITQAQTTQYNAASQTTQYNTTQPQTTLGSISVSSVFQKYQTIFIILFIIIGLSILSILGYIFIINRKTSINNSN
jgi:hypothetical protein